MMEIKIVLTLKKSINKQLFSTKNKLYAIIAKEIGIQVPLFDSVGFVLDLSKDCFHSL